MIKFDEIANTATKPHKNWTNRQVAQFHFFNPHGLMAQKKATDAQIDDLVNSGKANTGAYIAYGSLNDFHRKELIKLIDKKRVNSIDLAVTLSGLRDAIKSAQEFIDEKNPKKESDIELFVEKQMNRLDKKLMQGHISQTDYDAMVMNLNDAVENEIKSV